MGIAHKLTGLTLPAGCTSVIMQPRHSKGIFP